MQFLQESLSADYKNSNIRLREGEYQYDLAKTIAHFQLQLLFPNVKDIITIKYGEENSNDTQFVRKVQTILKKMEKSNIVRILPKKKPWELQSYVLSSFRFRDSGKDLVVLATDQEMKQAQNLLRSVLNQMGPVAQPGGYRARVFILLVLTIASYVTVLWDLMQSVIDPFIFIPAFSIAVACSILLGRALSRD